MEIVRNYLASRTLHACEEWVNGCVEFYQAEHQGQEYLNSELLEFVAQQWALADLRDISPGCLPPNVVQQMKITLAGKYSLQVESVLNIAQPCYSQLQKIRQVSTENIEISDKPMQSWEPKGKRMLQLHLCDGTQEVKAVEYKPMPSLDKRIIPGTKVLVVGPVDCRRGVLLLQEHNLQLIGGEVDSLIIPNATENILARKLQLPENPDPYGGPQSTMHITDVPAEEPLIDKGMQVPARAPVESQFPDDDELLDLDDQLSALEQQYEQKSLVQTSVAQQSQLDEQYRPSFSQTSVTDDWYAAEEQRYEEEMKDLDLDALEMQSQYDVVPVMQHGQVSSTLKQQNQSKQPLEQQGRQGLLPPAQQQGYQCGQTSATWKGGQRPSVAKQVNQYRQPSCTKVQDNQRDQVSAEEWGENRLGEMSFDTQEQQSLLELCNKAEQFLNEDDNMFVKMPSEEIGMKSLKNLTAIQPMPGPSSSALMSLKRFSAQESDREVPSSVVERKCSTVLTSRKQPFVSRPEEDKFLPSLSVHKQSTTMQHTILQHECDTSKKKFSDIDRPLAVMTSSPSDSLQSVEAPHSPILKERRVDLSPVLGNKMDSSPMLKEKVEVKVEAPVKLNPHPFVYLCQVSDVPVASTKLYVVKGFILTLLSRLSVVNSDSWHLKAKVCDGSAVLDVNFSSDVLEKLIGFSPSEMTAMKRQIASNPLLKERVTKAFQKSQQALIDLNCLMHIQFMPGEELPCVVEIEDVTLQHEDALIQRLQEYSCNNM